MGAPKVRKHLSADALFARLRNGWAKMDEHRSGTPDIPWRDALLSAFAMFARKSPSLLACDQERAEGHVQGVVGIERVPCDTAMRERPTRCAPTPFNFFECWEWDGDKVKPCSWVTNLRLNQGTV